MSGAARPEYWLITRHEDSWMDVFTIELTGEVMLPIFGHEEEANAFLRSGIRGEGWRTRATTTGELVSLLYGPFSEATLVTLDPAAGIEIGTTAILAGMRRKDFVDFLLRDGGPNAPERNDRISLLSSDAPDKTVA